jgi:DNA polymerase-3 subunit delta'
MSFASDIFGHAAQVAMLNQALDQGRLHHAYIFLGPDGVGKKALALALAKAIHCGEAAHDYCGGCASCVKIDKGNHPDVRLIAPLPGKKEISIEQVRTLEKELNYRSFSGKKKIGIIDPASLMNMPAQNALLKTLEEPPADSLLILVSASAGGLLPTLLSRCLRLAFAPLPAADVVRYLVERKKLSPDHAALAASVSLGSLGRALSAEMTELAGQRTAWIDEMAAMRQSAGWAALAEDLAKDRADALQFLEWLAEWYRDVMIYLVTGDAESIGNRDLLDKLRAEAGRITVDDALRLRAAALETAALIRRNVNRRMALENIFADIAGIPARD